MQDLARLHQRFRSIDKIDLAPFGQLVKRVQRNLDILFTIRGAIADLRHDQCQTQFLVKIISTNAHARAGHYVGRAIGFADIPVR